MSGGIDVPANPLVAPEARLWFWRRQWLIDLGVSEAIAKQLADAGIELAQMRAIRHLIRRGTLPDEAARVVS
jgi:hypothetical protein